MALKAALLLMTCAVWLTALRDGFVFDDLVNVVGNSWVKNWHLLPRAFGNNAAGFDPDFSTSFYRPLMHVFYAATYGFAGLRPWPFHLVNVLMHAVAVLLVWVLTGEVVRRWSEPEQYPLLPIVAAVVFSLHPAHTEAVTWIAGITDVSYTVFGLAALLAYIRAVEHRRPVFSAGALLFASLLCKETAVMFVVMVCLVEAFEASRGESWTLRDAVTRIAPVLIAAVVYLAMRVAALGSFAPSAHQHPHTMAELVATAATLFGFYVSALIAPLTQHVMLDVGVHQAFADAMAVLGVIAILALTALLVRFRRRPMVVLAVAFSVLPLLPPLYVPAIESGHSLFGERYLYLPVLGIAWCAGFGFEAVRRYFARGPAIAAAVAVVFVVWSSAVVTARISVWHDSMSFWTAAAAESPQFPAAQEGLCFALYNANRYMEAVDQCDRAIALDPTASDARVNRATALLALGRPREAKREFDAVLAVRRNTGLAWINRGLACMVLGQTEEALFSYRTALELSPDSAEAHNDLGVALVRLGRPLEGCPHLERAARIEPDNPEFRSNVQACGR